MGEAVGWVNDGGVSLQSVSRHKVEPSTSGGQAGLTAKVTLSDILQKEHNITPVNLFKTAVAAFNVHTTGSAEALFSHLEAARNFPFLDENAAYAALLPNPMDLAGPMGQRLVDRIAISPDDRLLDVLANVQADSIETTRHAHAPIYKIKDLLENNKQSLAAGADAEVFMDTLQRQIFNWVPSLPASDKGHSGSTDMANSVPLLKPVQQLSTGDCGFVWTGKRYSQNTVRFFVWWDDAQMGLREAKSAFAEVLASMRWMTDSANWTKTLNDWWKNDCDEMTRECEADIELGNGEL